MPLASAKGARFIPGMFGVTTSDDYKPVTYVGRYPVDVTMLLLATHILCMVLTCLALAAGGGAFITWLMFDSAQVLHSHAYHQIATYAFIHPPYPASALLWFAIEMYMLFAFGREVERFIGRRGFIMLYALLLVAPTLILTLAGFWMRVGLSGSGTLHLGIFLAFAAIYPNVEMFFLRIQVKWIALVLVAIGTLAALAVHDWGSLIVLWTTVAAAYLFIRGRGVGGEPAWWTSVKEKFQPKPKFAVVPRTTPRRVVEPEDVYDSIDPLLEKISKSGINSLSASERRTLDRARAQLLNKSK